MNDVEQSCPMSAGRASSKGSLRRRGLLLGGLAAVAFAVLPAAAQAITPTIVNGSRAIMNNTSSSESGSSANRVELLPVVKHDPGLSVTGVKIDSDYDGTDNTAAAGTTAVTTQQPTGVAGGFNYSRSYISFANTVQNIPCGSRPGLNKTVRFRAVLSDGSTTASVSSSIFMMPAGDCTGYTDYPFMFSRTQVAPVSLNTGGTSTFGFTADAPGGNDWYGYVWRLRRVNDGATTTPTAVCFGSNQDNTAKTLTPTFSRRGHWIVEAWLMVDSCTQTSSNNTAVSGKYWRIGSADVNTPAASSPELTLSATRPQANAVTTVTATTNDADDSAEGGAVQYIEWDCNNDLVYEKATLGTAALTGAGQDSNALTTAEKQTTCATSGQAPGTYTVRARVTDNGAINAADTIRQQKVATTTYVVNSPPVLTAPASASTETGSPVGIALSATDADSDTRTYSVTAGPSNGTGSFTSTTGASTTYNYTPDAGFAGTDSITFRVSDGFGGTDSKTVAITVYPQTQIDSGPAEGSTTNDESATFTFSSPTTGATFECAIDNGAYTPCTSPKDYSGLSDGSHTFQVRAVAASLTDPTPASRTFNVDATAPDTTIDSGPAEGSTTNEESATFTFSSSEGGSTFECSFDGGAFTTCTSPATYSNLAPGEHTFQVRATDQYGNTDGSPDSRTFTITDAAIVSSSGSTITFQAAPGDSNNVTVTGGSGAPYVFTDNGSGATVGAGPGCTQVSPTTVSCPDTGITTIVVNLGDGNDAVNAAGTTGANFTLNGGTGNDQITGGPGADTLNGGGSDAGMDRLRGGPGSDALNGGPGIDRALYDTSTGDADVTIGTGADDADGLGGTDNVAGDVESITGGSGSDALTGSCLPNTLAGQGGNDTLNGDPGSCVVFGGDFFGGGSGNDAFNGGPGGPDQVTYTTNTASQPISVTLDGDADDADGLGGTDNIGNDVEYVFGGAGDDTIDATAATQGVSLWGRAGNDTLIGSAFNDFLRGEAGNDQMDCAGGTNDMYDVDAADDPPPVNCETPG